MAVPDEIVGKSRHANYSRSDVSKSYDEKDERPDVLHDEKGRALENDPLLVRLRDEHPERDPQKGGKG